MKFSCPSNVAAILCLLAASGSDAFAPSTSTSMTSTIRLKAGSDDLTSLLGEYSGSAYSSSPAVTKAVEKVAEKTVEKVAEVVVTVAPTTPAAPPVVVDAAPAIVDNFAAVNEAASAAQSAAEQAAAAAASLAAKSMPVIKAAATGAAAGGMSLKPLIGSVFVQVDSSKINPDLQFDASARAKENLAILKANFMAGLGGLGGAATSLNIPNFEGGNDGGGDMSLQAIVDSLHLQEYGGWYAAAAMAIVATQQKSSGKKEAASQFESELTQAQQKANEAAMAAGAAAAGAKLAKDLAMKMDQETRKDSGLALLESSKMKKIVLEKETMEQKIRELQTEVSKLNTQLEKAEEGKKKAVETVVAKTEIEEEYPNKVTLEGDPEEDARIIELLKMMDEENKAKKAKAAAEAEKKREEEAKYVKSQKNIDKKMTKGVEAAQAKAEVATKKTRATKKKSTATKAKAKTSTKKKTTSEKAAPKSETEASPVAAKEPEPVAANEPESDAANDGGDDWTQLAESALKRKTVKELTEYLTEKGVSVEKSMKKADLVEAVRSL
ncbi:hypothetical protein ACHAXM_008878 [Skeletonema potamos]|jgi:hypothetical protein